MQCPLCEHPDSALFWQDSWREYRHCPRCAIYFVPSRFHLSREEELERYHLHNNEVKDPGYRAFLNRAYEPLKLLLKPGARGLDFGCGPGPALVAMMREDGFVVDGYDKYFADIPPSGPYDFITCTETAEHFRDPAASFRWMDSLLQPGAWLALMTEEAPDDKNRFASWYYHQDPTHVLFYSDETMRWLCRFFGWTYTFPRPNVWLLQKRSR